MRYSKGTIALSQTQDLPLLRQVMYSKYVTQTQLWQFMRHSGYELSRGSFWWRVKRLEEHGFITRYSLPMAHSDPIFAIASSGLVYLVENVAQISLAIYADALDGGHYASDNALLAGCSGIRKFCLGINVEAVEMRQ